MENDESAPHNDEQRQGGATPYADVTQQQWEDDLDTHSLDEAEAREHLDDTEAAHVEGEEWQVAEGEDDDISG